MECGPCWVRLSYLLIHMKARNWGRMCRARLKHSPSRVGTVERVRRVRPGQASAKLGDGLCQVESEQPPAFVIPVAGNKPGQRVKGMPRLGCGSHW